MAGKQKLTDEQKAQIRELREKEGIPFAALAARFGVSQNTIIRVCKPTVYEKTLASNRRSNANNASSIYQNEKISRRRFVLAFSHRNDPHVIKHLEKQDNVQDYVRQLIINDMTSTSSSPADAPQEKK